MKKLLLILLLFSAITGLCQPGDTISAKERRLQRKDSIILFYKNKRDSLTKALLLSDSNLIKQNRKINTDYFVRLQKEIRAKKKKDAITKIVLGIALLAVLVIGLRRRRKK